MDTEVVVEVVVEVGAPAHGGHCVARVDDPAGRPGRVLFVRHALPGERVRARVTRGAPKDRFWFADAVEVLVASPDRVEAPCPLAGPGLCGGCDLQHATPEAQRRWKAAVVTDVLARIGGLDPGDLPAVTVEALPGRADNLAWRTRVRFAATADGTLGLHRHRGDVIPVEHCPIAAPGVDGAGVTAARWPGAVEVAVAAGTDGTAVTALVPTAGGAGTAVARRPGPAAGRGAAGAAPTRAPALPPRDWRRPEGVGVTVTSPGAAPARQHGRAWVGEAVEGVEGVFRVGGTGFWQAHAAAPAAYVAAVREALAPVADQRLLDLYCGSGLFAAALADDVGPGGAVTAVEGDARAAADARRNLHSRPQVRILEADVASALSGIRAAAVDGQVDGQVDGPVDGAAGGPVDGVVLDPPRSGAGHAVVDAVAALRPARVAYVACDPAALARDVKRFAGHGYVLDALRAFDAYPMTHHVECVATLVPAPGRGSGTEAGPALGQDGGSGAARPAATLPTTSEVRA